MFRPKIIGFVCNWSLPMGIDFAGNNGARGYPKVRIVRVMCVGRIDPVIVLDIFAKGADGVLLIGCHPPDCHFIKGNLQAERKIKMLKKLIFQTGLEPDRLGLEWTYASEIERFSKVVTNFWNQMTALGPSPLAGEKPDTKLLLNIEAAKAVAEDFRLRVLVGRERELAEKENTYGKKVSREEFDELMDAAVGAEYLRSKIFLLTKNGSLSVIDLSKLLEVEPREVLRHIVVLRQRGLVALDRVEGENPLYKALEVP